MGRGGEATKVQTAKVGTEQEKRNNIIQLFHDMVINIASSKKKCALFYHFSHFVKSERVKLESKCSAIGNEERTISVQPPLFPRSADFLGVDKVGIAPLDLREECRQASSGEAAPEEYYTVQCMSLVFITE